RWRRPEHVAPMRKCRQKDLTGCNQSVVGTAPNSSLNMKGMELLDFYAICARRRKMENSGKPQGLVPGKETERIHQVIDEIAQYLQQHCSESIRLDELSARFYISRSRMTYMFKQITGFTVVEYLSFVRVRRAEGLLCETDLSITEIAGETGFGNVTYFERVFRTATGLAPLQYRKKNSPHG
ncbi:helix-turn-helix domain-containing protein, partial [Bacillota bacterium LCP21S3_D8]